MITSTASKLINKQLIILVNSIQTSQLFLIYERKST
jgi:hypothetical protein